MSWIVGIGIVKTKQAKQNIKKNRLSGIDAYRINVEFVLVGKRGTKAFFPFFILLLMTCMNTVYVVCVCV